MKITRVEIYPIPLVMREPYTIAYHTVTEVTNVGMTLHFADGLISTGIAGPEEEVTGETAHTVLDTARNIIEPYLHGNTFGDIYETISSLDALLGSQRAALALVDTALFDYAAKKAGLPLHAFLGATRNSLATAITINIHPPEETLRRAKKLTSEGYSILKIKGGLDPDEDLRKLQRIRKELGAAIPIILDLNQGYSQEQITDFYSSASDLNILCIEQPTEKGNRDLLCSLSKRNEIPVMVDESLVTLEDARFFGSRGIQYFNVKLMKVGGILAAQALDAVATEFGTKVITSCMDEAALANVFGLAFSLASQNVDFVDLDSFTDYAQDPTRPLLHFERGRLFFHR